MTIPCGITDPCEVALTCRYVSVDDVPLRLKRGVLNDVCSVLVVVWKAQPCSGHDLVI